MSMSENIVPIFSEISAWFRKNSAPSKKELHDKIEKLEKKIKQLEKSNELLSNNLQQLQGVLNNLAPGFHVSISNVDIELDSSTNKGHINIDKDSPQTVYPQDYVEGQREGKNNAQLHEFIDVVDDEINAIRRPQSRK